MPRIRLLSREDIRQTLDMPTAIARMGEAYAALSGGRATVPVRQSLPIPEHKGQVLIMPAWLPHTGAVSVKIVSAYPENPARHLPFIQALVVVLDAADGRPLAIMNGECLTALRTGAGAGLATDLLARKDAEAAAIFGPGVQGRTQLEAVCAVRDIRRTYVFGRTPEKTEAFAREMTALLNHEVVPATEPAQLRKADIVCTATSSRTPVFAHADVAPGAHINGVGSFRPDMAEIPVETVRAAKVVVDQRAACLAEAGDIIQPLNRKLIDENHIYGEIGEIVSGDVAGRTSPDEITLFKSVGNAAQDLAAAAHIVREAERRELGMEVEV